MIGVPGQIHSGGGRGGGAAPLAITAGGAIASVDTTVLMTVEETHNALAKGKAIGYRRPGEAPLSCLRLRLATLKTAREP